VHDLRRDEIHEATLLVDIQLVLQVSDVTILLLKPFDKVAGNVIKRRRL